MAKKHNSLYAGRRIQWTDGTNTYVVRKGKTTNKKIADPNEYVVQTYTFSNEQIEYVRTCDINGVKLSQKEFFSFDKANCMDCPLSGNSGNGKCYTHKYMQFSGFVSMIRSIIKVGDVGHLDAEKRAIIVGMCKDTYVRFGTYGEPSLLDLGLICDMTSDAKSWTGYTHQAGKPWAQSYSAYFMASAHSDKQAVSLTGWRSFIAIDKTESSDAVVCPASKESNYVSMCSKCGLCAGILGKGRKNVQIQLH
jgi:hypothetical protein